MDCNKVEATNVHKESRQKRSGRRRRYAIARMFIDIQGGVTEKSHGCDMNITEGWVWGKVEPKYAIQYFIVDVS
jgi:hypothetical protein